MTSRRIAESLELAESLPAGRVRNALIESCRCAGWQALSDATRHDQDARAAVQRFCWEDAINSFVAAGETADQARAVVALLEADAPPRRQQ